MKEQVNPPIVSVVIPMYNCQEYVEELLYSLSKQTLSDMEVICVDDGSTDDTLNKVKAFCEEDSRFSYVTKENGGAGSARNAGIEMARGKYVMFLDADDEYSQELLKELVTAAERYQVDEVFCLLALDDFKTNMHTENHGFNRQVFPPDMPVKTESVKHVYNRLPVGPTNTLFRLDIIRKHHLQFSTTTVADDVFFIYAYASLTENVLGVHKQLLTYKKYKNTGSLTSGRWRHTEDVVKVMLDLHKWLNENNLYDKYRENYLEAFIQFIFYNSGFSYNSQYVEALAEALCRKDLYGEMSEQAFYDTYWKRFDTEAMKQKIKNLQKDSANAQPVQEWSNRLLTIQEVERTAREKYGRILNPKNGEEQNLQSLEKTVLFLKNEKTRLEKEAETGKALAKRERDELESTRKKLESTQVSLKKTKSELKKVRESWTFRSGKAITVVPGRIRDALAAGKHMSEEAASKNHELVAKEGSISEKQKVCISVIIPVFNVEKYIRACLDALMEQTMEALEYIFIDDCSTDGSMAIVEEYKEKDSRIRTVYNEQNIGAGATRNRGIDLARGEYLSFIDSDDWVNTRFYESLYQVAKKTGSDIVKGHVQCIGLDGKDKTSRYFLEQNDRIRQLMKEGGPMYYAFDGAHWSAIYRKEVLEKNNIRYGTMQSAEDTLFLVAICTVAESIAFANDAVYFYRLREGSLSDNGNKMRHYASLASLEGRIEILNNLKEGDLDDYAIRHIRIYSNNTLSRFRQYMQKQAVIDPREVREFLQELERILEKTGQKDGILKQLSARESILQDLANMRQPISEGIELSVIIPVYNVSPYLPSCLDSVKEAIQGIRAEIICVDDGSDDGSDIVLDNYAKKDSRFHVYHVAHAGVGEARNYGVLKATGKYMAFVDGDDCVAPSLYRDMIYLCETKNVPVCVSNITRFRGDFKGEVAFGYQLVYAAEPLLLTSMEEQTSRINDSSSCNKLIRRDFWDAHCFRFPKMVHYEDMALFVPLLCSTDRFAVLHSFGYYWRMRPGGQSLSQQCNTMASLEDRMLSSSRIFQFLRETYGKDAPICQLMEKRLICWEFDIHLLDFHKMDNETRDLFLKKISDFYREWISEDTVQKVPEFHRQRYKYIMQKDADGVARLMNHRRIAWRSTPIVERNGKHYLKMPQDIYDVEYQEASGELKNDLPVTKLTSMERNGTWVTMNMVVYQPRVNVPEPDSQDIKVFLYNEHTGKKIYLPCNPVETTSWTKQYGQVVCQDDYRAYEYNYDWAGVRVSMDFSKILKEDEESRNILAKPYGVNPRWLLFIEYDNRVLKGYRPLRGINPKPKKAMDAMDMVVEQDGEKYRYDFVQDIRGTLYIEMEKA